MSKATKASDDFLASPVWEAIQLLMTADRLRLSGARDNDGKKFSTASLAFSNQIIDIERLIAAEIRKARIEAMEECLDIVFHFLDGENSTGIYKEIIKAIAAERAKENQP